MMPVNFYARPEWLSIRYQVLNKYGARCMVCNRGRGDGAIIDVDHIKPKSKFPELALTIENLQILCRECNLGKSDKYDTDHRPMRHVMNAIRPGRRFKFGSRPWREIPKERRRGVVCARILHKISIKISKAETDGDLNLQRGLMKTYLDFQRKIKTHASTGAV